jgi:hypothetical protein
LVDPLLDESSAKWNKGKKKICKFETGVQVFLKALSLSVALSSSKKKRGLTVFFSAVVPLLETTQHIELNKLFVYLSILGLPWSGSVWFEPNFAELETRLGVRLRFG